MEGPSLYLAKKQLRPFIGQTILTVDGNTKIDKDRFAGKKVKDIFSWGKHLVFQFDTFALRVHFLLYGTFSAIVEGVSVTGDYKKARTPRLLFTFSNGVIEMYNCSVIIFEVKRMKKQYDFSIDVMSTAWDTTGVFKAMKKHRDEQIADVLLDQTVFAGVGNIIKNEILSQAFVSPKRLVDEIPPKKLRELIKRAKEYSIQFYKWRKAFVLRKNLDIHRKGSCPHCGAKMNHEKTGKRNRWSYWCETCQP